MGLFKGGALRLFQTFLYLLAFCCAGIILGVYSYFLSVLADRNLHIAPWKKAVEGMSGIAVVYTFVAFFLTCCLGGVTFFGILGLILDLCFCGAMIAIAILADDGANSCSGYVRTPIGSGQSNVHQGFEGKAVYEVKLGLACRLNTAAFAVAIIGAFIFLITALMQIALIRHHKKEKRYGPGPNNNYTAGSGRRFGGFGGRFGRNKRNVNTRDAEMATSGGALAPPTQDMRPSHDTGYTGSTVGGAGFANADKHEHAGYHTGPTGTAVPHGYNATSTNY